MNDDEIRALVREAIQRHLGSGGNPSGLPERSGVRGGNPSGVPEHLGTGVRGGNPLGLPEHGGVPEPVTLTFSRYKVQRIGDDGMCLIEPAVRCNHCGYCECHGH
jgi:hypothetical protein